MGRIVGIDFGIARIGLAITDASQIIAQPIGAIRAGKTDVETVQLIAKELSRYTQIEAIVIGLPLLLSGKEGEMAEKVRAFAKVLEETLSLPVRYWDERLTSAQVERMLVDSDVKRKERAKHSDTLAAAAILESYLSSLR